MTYRIQPNMNTNRRSSLTPSTPEHIQCTLVHHFWLWTRSDGCRNQGGVPLVIQGLVCNVLVLESVVLKD
jgi:hypothetical protein